MDGRKLVMAPTSETAMLKTDLFLKANERGDGGNGAAKRHPRPHPRLRHLHGPERQLRPVGQRDRQRSGHGAVCRRDRRRRAHRIRAGPHGRRVRGRSPATISRPGRRRRTPPSFTLNEALKYATADNAVATRYVKCVTAAAYAAGYSEGVALTVTEGKAPQVGQLLAFGATPALGTPTR